MTDLEQKDMFGDHKYDLDVVEVSLDGSTYPTNPGAGGIGLVFRFRKDEFLHIKTISRSIPRWVELTGDLLKLAKTNKTKKPQDRDGKQCMETTNNRCEILAMMEAMNRVKDPSKTHLIIHADSQWAINMTNGLWKAKENKELVMRSRKMAKKFAVLDIKWIRGHAGDRFNEWCDELAYSAARNQPRVPVVEYIKEGI